MKGDQLSRTATFICNAVNQEYLRLLHNLEVSRKELPCAAALWGSVPLVQHIFPQALL